MEWNGTEQNGIERETLEWHGREGKGREGKGREGKDTKRNNGMGWTGRATWRHARPIPSRRRSTRPPCHHMTSPSPRRAAGRDGHVVRITADATPRPRRRARATPSWRRIPNCALRRGADDERHAPAEMTCHSRIASTDTTRGSNRYEITISNAHVRTSAASRRRPRRPRRRDTADARRDGRRLIISPLRRSAAPCC